jgi:hypothetical protein
MPCYPGPLTFGGTTRTLDSFKIGFHQRYSDTIASEFHLGPGEFLIELNETNADVLGKNLPVVEDALVHEAMHLFSDVVVEDNANRPAGAAMADPNLDPASYGPLHSRLQNAVLPFVTQIMALPSSSGSSLPAIAEMHADFTANKMIGEAFAFFESAIYGKQRAGQEFSAQDLSGVKPFYTFAPYWDPQPGVESELIAFLRDNRNQIEAAVKPIILEIGEKYLSLRP